MVKTYRAAKFLVTGPLVLGLLFVINLLNADNRIMPSGRADKAFPT